MNEFYVFDNENAAQAAINHIENKGGYPLINFVNGVPAPDKQKSERYAIPRQRQDGKWAFMRIPEARRNEKPQAAHDFFNTNFPHDIEEFNRNWFPTGNDEP